MKQHIKHLTLPVVASVLGINFAWANTNPTAEMEYFAEKNTYDFNNSTDYIDEDGYWVLHNPRCGMVIQPRKIAGQDINKYRFKEDLPPLRCSEPNFFNAAIIMVGNNVTLDLNGNTVNCGLDQETIIGVFMLTHQGKLFGHMPNVDATGQRVKREALGAIDGCIASVQVGNPTKYRYEQIFSGVSEAKNFPISYQLGENEVSDVDMRNCILGVGITSDGNHIHHNVIHCGRASDTAQHVNDIERSLVFSAGVSINAAPIASKPTASKAIPHEFLNVSRNRIEYNHFYANDVGFYGGNQIGVISPRRQEEANIVYRNLAETNYGDGFAIVGPGLILERNVATDNEGSGFSYNYTGLIPFHGYFDNPKNTPTVIFKRNGAYSNLKGGIVAGEKCGVSKGGWHDSCSNGAEFIGNRAYHNGDYQLYDANEACSASFYNLDRLNAWSRNYASAHGVNDPCLLNRWF